MTQRVALATVMDRLSIDAVITDYAAAVDDGAWDACTALFTPDGRADHRRAGGAEESAAEGVRWLAERLRNFPVRQHLVVNRRLDLEDLGGYPGDHARVRADYFSPMGPAVTGDAGSTPAVLAGGRYVFELRRTDAGWRIRTVTAHEMWRCAPGGTG
ncbi:MULTISPECIES: nuclear transport factor 2 family protein [unclassified Streptomyces]|uniref:nuclear transport factor 2 family protein n=1 Tax=unclassified Streptomyces TaxID=2593676 RepID=UPI000CDAF81F|nr:nuclear transport factor 2 family protein [Streptomyces sp. SM10]